MTQEAIDQGYRELAEAVIIQACRDAKWGKREALAWIHSDTAQLWADELGIDPMQWAGILKRIDKHIQTKKSKMRKPKND